MGGNEARRAILKILVWRAVTRLLLPVSHPRRTINVRDVFFWAERFP